MNVIWAILCQNVIVSQQSNNISLIEVIDELTVPVPPPQTLGESDEEFSATLDFRLTVFWARSDHRIPERGQSRVKLVAPDGRESTPVEQEIDLTQFPRMRSIGRMIGSPLPLTQEGQYRFIIEVKTPDSDWQEVSELPLWVAIQTDNPPGEKRPQAPSATTEQ